MVEPTYFLEIVGEVPPVQQHVGGQASPQAKLTWPMTSTATMESATGHIEAERRAALIKSRDPHLVGKNHVQGAVQKPTIWGFPARHGGIP